MTTNKPIAERFFDWVMKKSHQDIPVDKIRNWIRKQPENKPLADWSDGYHTFDELYRHRHALFIALCNCNPSKAWKAKKHSDGSMFSDEWFIAGIETEAGQATYHLPISYFALLQVPEHEFAPRWDGHTSEDVISRIQNFKPERMFSLEEVVHIAREAVSEVDYISEVDDCGHAFEANFQEWWQARLKELGV